MTMTGPGRTLYVSDLDDTLFGGDGAISATSREMLAGLVEGGLSFTIATARSPLTARAALGDLVLQAPVVAYGGSTAIDTDGTNLWWEHFDPRTLHPFVGASLAAGVTPLVFWREGGAERISWVRGAETAGVDSFVEQRVGDPRLKAVDGWDEVDHDRAFFVSLVGEYIVLRRLARMVRAISWGLGCSLSLQRDAEDGTMAVLDVTPATATKGTGVRRLAELGGFTRIVAFGDGANDLPLFAEADESYAVEGASDEVKAAATAVIGGSGQDAVARFLQERVAQEV